MENEYLRSQIFKILLHCLHAYTVFKFNKNIAPTTSYVAKLKNLYFLNKDFFVIVVKYQEYG